MAMIEREKFNELANEQSRYCVSIYVPSQPVGENRESILALKNQASAIGNQLIGMGLSSGEAEVYLEPIRELIGATGMWRFMQNSLAVFRSRETFFHISLPVQMNEFSTVSDRFHLLPLLELFNMPHEFFLLRLSLNGNTLYRANTEEISIVPTEGIFPENMHDSTGVDNENTSLQFRGGQTMEGLGLYGGVGRGKDLKDREMRKYMQDIDTGLANITGNDSLPLVVASVEHVFSLFKNITTYKNLYPVCISGNYDHAKDHVLHEKALELLKPCFEEERNKSKQMYRESAGKVISATNEVIRSAYEGKVDTLFVARESHLWGTFDEQTGVLRRHEEKQPMDKCLIDQAARQTFLKGGKVFLENQNDLPDSLTPLNAILRY